nr:MAG TPA: hypothetical protein [Caudoviricetes sp.]
MINSNHYAERNNWGHQHPSSTTVFSTAVVQLLCWRQQLILRLKFLNR